MRSLAGFPLVLILLVGCQSSGVPNQVEQAESIDVLPTPAEEEFIFKDFSRVASLELGKKPWVYGVSSLTGDLLVVSAGDGEPSPTVDVLDSSSLSFLEAYSLPFDIEDSVFSAVFNDDGRQIAVNDYEIAWNFSESKDGQQAVRFDNDLKGFPWGTFSTDGEYFYFSQNSPEARVRVIEVATGEEQEPLRAGPVARALFATPDYLIVSNDDDRKATEDSVTVVSLADGNVVSQFLLGDRPFAFEYLASSNTLFVASIWSSEISAIDLETMSVLNRTEVGMYPSELALSPDGRLLAVGYTLAEVVAIFDSETLEELQRIEVGELMATPFFSVDGSRLFIGAGNELHAYETQD